MSQSLERLLSPGFIDIISPFVAFIFVFIMPSVFAIYVIVRVLRKDYAGTDPHN
jgi:hypothetical protein